VTAADATSDSIGQQNKPGFAKKFVGAILIVLLLLTVPALLGYWLGGESVSAAAGAAIGSLAGLLITSAAGQQTMLKFLPALALAAFAGYSLYGSPWWAAVCILLGLAVGWEAHRGLHMPLAIVAVVFCVAKPGVDDFSSTAYIIAIVLGAINGMLLARKLGAPERMAPPVLDERRSGVFALLVGGAVAAAVLVMSLLDSPQSYWLPMTVFILAVPKPGAQLAQRVGHRLLGTIVGVTLAGLAIWAGSPDGLGLLIASILLVAAFVIREPNWLNQTLVSAAVVLVMTPIYGNDVGPTRVVLTAVAGGITLLGLALWLWWEKRHVGEFDIDEDINEALASFSETSTEQAGDQVKQS
jgi:uncharacterized membrane protein (UPF0136 family)